MKSYGFITTATQIGRRVAQVLVWSVACASVASAQPADDEKLWKQLDLTEDGWLDGKELDGGWKKYDADGDSEVTKAEFVVGRAKERETVTTAAAGKPAQIASDGNLMTQAEILDFLSERMGTEPFKNPQRVQILQELVEIIRQRGLGFRDELRSDFRRQALKFSSSPELSAALHENYGAPTKQSWLMGTWTLGKTSAAVDFVVKDELWRQNEVSVNNVGILTLDPNGTYVWKIHKETLNGAWRKATDAEMRTQGGDGVVLLKGKATWDWIVMQNRVIELKDDRIYVKELGTRKLKEFGLRNTAKK
ncbi:MAG: hypothetical protein H7067_18500 [Burkholderiales bacterium]|nr:hypothetical protein [Opitutaceae bacterium]